MKAARSGGGVAAVTEAARFDSPSKKFGRATMGNTKKTSVRSGGGRRKSTVLPFEESTLVSISSATRDGRSSSNSKSRARDYAAASSMLLMGTKEKRDDSTSDHEPSSSSAAAGVKKNRSEGRNQQQQQSVPPSPLLESIHVAAAASVRKEATESPLVLAASNHHLSGDTGTARSGGGSSRLMVSQLETNPKVSTTAATSTATESPLVAASSQGNSKTSTGRARSSSSGGGSSRLSVSHLETNPKVSTAAATSTAYVEKEAKESPLVAASSPGNSTTSTGRTSSSSSSSSRSRLIVQQAKNSKISAAAAASSAHVEKQAQESPLVAASGPGNTSATSTGTVRSSSGGGSSRLIGSQQPHPKSSTASPSATHDETNVKESPLVAACNNGNTRNTTSSSSSRLMVSQLTNLQLFTTAASAPDVEKEAKMSPLVAASNKGNARTTTTTATTSSSSSRIILPQLGRSVAFKRNTPLELESGVLGWSTSPVEKSIVAAVAETHTQDQSILVTAAVPEKHHQPGAPALKSASKSSGGTRVQQTDASTASSPQLMTMQKRAAASLSAGDRTVREKESGMLERYSSPARNKSETEVKTDATCVNNEATKQERATDPPSLEKHAEDATFASVLVSNDIAEVPDVNRVSMVSLDTVGASDSSGQPLLRRASLATQMAIHKEFSKPLARRKTLRALHLELNPRQDSASLQELLANPVAFVRRRRSPRRAAAATKDYSSDNEHTKWLEESDWEDKLDAAWTREEAGAKKRRRLPKSTAKNDRSSDASSKKRKRNQTSGTKDDCSDNTHASKTEDEESLAEEVVLSPSGRRQRSCTVKKKASGLPSFDPAAGEPKLPPDAYSIFIQEHRPIVEAENPELSRVEVMATVNEKWGDLKAGERKKYRDREAKAHRDYVEQKKVWKDFQREQERLSLVPSTKKKAKDKSKVQSADKAQVAKKAKPTGAKANLRLPQEPLVRQADGTVLKPRGRAPAGHVWDEFLGTWTAKDAPTSAAKARAKSLPARQSRNGCQTKRIPTSIEFSIDSLLGLTTRTEEPSPDKKQRPERSGARGGQSSDRAKLKRSSPRFVARENVTAEPSPDKEQRPKRTGVRGGQSSNRAKEPVLDTFDSSLLHKPKRSSPRFDRAKEPVLDKFVSSLFHKAKRSSPRFAARENVETNDCDTSFGQDGNDEDAFSDAPEANDTIARSTARRSEINSGDSVIVPKTSPQKKSDGTLARPRGSAPMGYSWDAIHGHWKRSMTSEGSSADEAESAVSLSSSRWNSNNDKVGTIGTEKKSKSPLKDVHTSPTRKASRSSVSRGRSKEPKKRAVCKMLSGDAPGSKKLKSMANRSSSSEDDSSKVKKSKSEFTKDGHLIPAKAPVRKSDGTFARPPGRPMSGFAWNEIRGLWAPLDEDVTDHSDQPQGASKNAAPKKTNMAPPAVEPRYVACGSCVGCKMKADCDACLQCMLRKDAPANTRRQFVCMQRICSAPTRNPKLAPKKVPRSARTNDEPFDSGRKTPSSRGNKRDFERTTKQRSTPKHSNRLNSRRKPAPNYESDSATQDDTETSLSRSMSTFQQRRGEDDSCSVVQSLGETNSLVQDDLSDLDDSSLGDSRVSQRAGHRSQHTQPSPRKNPILSAAEMARKIRSEERATRSYQLRKFDDDDVEPMARMH